MLYNYSIITYMQVNTGVIRHNTNDNFIDTFTTRCEHYYEEECQL